MAKWTSVVSVYSFLKVVSSVPGSARRLINLEELMIYPQKFTKNENTLPCGLCSLKLSVYNVHKIPKVKE